MLQLIKLASCILALSATIHLASAAISSPVEQHASAPLSAPSPEDSSSVSQDCKGVEIMLDEQRQYFSREIGQLRREVAMLRQDLSTPGFKEVLAGIGYIFGLTGIGLYLKSRKNVQAK